MSERVVECVPNFSEGRDPGKVAALVAAIGGVAGVKVLKRESDGDHNRSVITFAGSPEGVVEAAFRGIRAARELIDLRRHEGVHPRIGAADVVPLVPVEGVSLGECVGWAHGLGERVWRELGVPVYFYEAAARSAERVRLENVRRGGFEGPAMAPDLGGPALHPTAGGVVIGARKFLIAYNINLNTGDVSVAKAIAKKIRTSSGGMACVKALGLMLESRGLAQVSMNLTDFEVTPVHAVFERVRAEAAAVGVTVAGSELIGLIPKKAIELTAAYFLQFERFESDDVLENRLREKGGL